MKVKGLPAVLILVCCALVVSWSISTVQAAEKKPLKIGFVVDLTGAYADMGTHLQNAGLIWIDLINKAGGIKGFPVEYAIYDGQSDPNKSILAMKKLIDVDKVHVVLGGLSTGNALAMTPLSEENEIPFLISTVSEMFEVQYKPRWAFRANWYTWEETSQILSMLKALNPAAKSVASLYPNLSYGKLVNKQVQFYAPKLDFKVVAEERYDFGNTDMGAQITNIMTAKPDVIVVTLLETTGCLAIKQMRERKVDKLIATNGSIASPVLVKSFKDVFCIPPYTHCPVGKADVWDQFPKDSEEYKLLSPVASVFEQKHGLKYSVVPQLQIDALNLIKDAAERGLSGNADFLNGEVKAARKTIRDKLEETKDFNTGGAVFTFTPERHAGSKPGTHSVPVRFEKGNMIWDKELGKKLVPLTPPPPEFYK